MKIIEVIVSYILFIAVIVIMAAVLTTTIWIMILCILGIKAQVVALFLFCLIFIITWIAIQHLKSVV